ncbi:ankyrin repeat-containing domain protein [Mycena rebaudengoi]|nr:ankyrin repeat-containing domain protein [Mycena rebaudengoi]
MPSEPANAYYISHVSGGTGGAGGRGGQEGGGGGAGHGPSFQAETIVIQNNPAERNKIIEWASPLNFFPRQADILNTRQPGTGEWLLQDSMFKKWKEGGIQVLWCRGMPGVGKTVLASIVINHLRENLANENTGVAVLYLDHRAIETHSPPNLLAVHAPILEETYSVLHSTLSDFSSVFIVVDALDEYPEEYRDPLLRRLCQLESPVRLMLTSRPHISIDHIIPNIDTLDIRATEEDIREYVRAQILKSSRLSRHIAKASDLQHTIEEKIVKRSDGMRQNVAAVRDALMSLPSDLNATYDDIVDRINRQNEDDKQLAWRTLSWLTNAKRPMRPPQLREALAIQPGATALDSDGVTDMDIILSVCAGLVVVDEVDDKVGFIHYTTQMCFQLARVRTSVFPHAQSEITLTCFTYMSLTFEAFAHRLRHPFLLFTHNPFLHYTVDYCLVHACRIPRGYRRSSDTDEVRMLVEQGVSVNDGAVQEAVFHGHEEIVGLLLGHSAKHNPQASRTGNEAIVELLIAHGVNINAEGGDCGSALQAAVLAGHESVVKLLIQHGADVNGKGGSALQIAVREGPEELIKLLLEHGADLNAGGGGNGSMLRVAVRRVNDAAVRLLIENGANINAEGNEDYGSLLEEALWEGNEEAARLLIKQGAPTNVNVKGGRYGSALKAALWNGHESIFKLLIECGAGVNAEGGEYGSLLQAAMWKGQEEAARLLIECGADINAKGGKYGSALKAALWNGHESIFKLLIERGADVNEGREYGCLLQAAASKGREEAARLLISHGADVNAKGGEYGGALNAALWNRHESIFKMLIEHGADVNAYYAGRRTRGTALQGAAWTGQKAAVELLLKRGADVNTWCPLAGTALSIASTRDHDIADLLRAYGATKGGTVSRRSREYPASVLFDPVLDSDSESDWEPTPARIPARENEVLQGKTRDRARLST